MMPTRKLSRRAVVRTAAAAGLAGTAGLQPLEGGAQGRRTPPLTADDIAGVEQALGKKGSLVADQAVYTVPLPRNDLKVTLRGEPVPIPFGFGGWVSFKKTLDGRQTVLMSDVVLLQEEVNAVLSAAQENGLEISAIHNHFFYEEPRIFYMHVHGMGELGRLARAYSAAVRPAKIHPANQPPPGPPPARTGREIFDLPRLDAIMKYQGVVNGPTYKYTIGRADLTVLAMGAEITAAIGLNSWASFAGSMERAHVAGDVAMLEPEVNPVIRALRRNGLEIVALHHHMLGEQPRMVFLHYYGTGPAEQLARGFRAGLDELGRAAGHGR